MARDLPGGIRSIDQYRSSFAWAKVQAIGQGGGDRISDYRDNVRKASALIQTAGLGQAVAYVASRTKAGKGGKKSSLGYLYEHLQEWLCGPEGGEREGPPPILGPRAGDHESREWRLLDRLARANGLDYRLATREAIALLLWLKRFAEAQAGD